jgi:hypothetical protein
LGIKSTSITTSKKYVGSFCRYGNSGAYSLTEKFTGAQVFMPVKIGHMLVSAEGLLLVLKENYF